MLTKQYYLDREHAARIGVWYSATGVFSMFSGLVNYGLSSINSGLAPWKVLYFFAGSFTILFGILFTSLVPASPLSRPLISIKGYNVFSPQEAGYLDSRLKREEDSLKEEEWTFKTFKQAALDVKLHLFFLIAFATYLVCFERAVVITLLTNVTQVNGAVTGFGSYIVKSVFGYGGAVAIALQAPGGATTALSIYLVGWLSLRHKNSRLVLLIASCIPVLVGALMLWLGPWKSRPGVFFAGLYLLPIFGSTFVMMLSLATANVRGKVTSSLASGYIFVGYALSNIAAPYTFKASELEIQFRTTWITIVVAQCCIICLTVLLALKLKGERRRNPNGLDRL